MENNQSKGRSRARSGNSSARQSRGRNQSSGRNNNNRGGRGRSSRGGGRGGNRSRNRRSMPNGIPMQKFVNKLEKTPEEFIYTPMNHFSDFSFDERLQKNITAAGFETPTAIQDQSIPFALVGQDILGTADTGSGKTAAFLLPMINKMLLDRKEQAIIIAPTRELALQINESFQKFSKGLNLFSAVAIGGTSMRNQLYHLRKRHNVIIGTPGRLKDLVERKKVNMWHYHTIVLDEVDKMLDMGFRDDIEFLISKMSDERQSLFFSATKDDSVERLMRRFLAGDFIEVSVKKRDTSEQVDQDVVMIKHGDNKVDSLHDLLDQDHVEKTLIFTRTKARADKLTRVLSKRGFKVSTLHGDKSQQQRQKALSLFKKDSVEIMVATDIAARGLDIPEVTHVINFDAPDNYEDYIHRIGRTGRASNIGYALTFVEEKQVNQKNEVMPVQAMRSRGGGNRRGGNRRRR